jgi:hypothetical protein
VDEFDVELGVEEAAGVAGAAAGVAAGDSEDFVSAGFDESEAEEAVLVSPDFAPPFPA